MFVFYEEIISEQLAVFSGLVLFLRSPIEFKNIENHKSLHAGIRLGQVNWSFVEDQPVQGFHCMKHCFSFQFFKGGGWLRMADLSCNVSDVSSNINEW